MNEVVWEWRELCAALMLPELSGPQITNVCIDSRRMSPGALFVALPGDPGPRFHPGSRSDRDGHDYVLTACEQGAAGALVREDWLRQQAQTPAFTLPVADTIDALWSLARVRRQGLKGPVIAVTGSSGKTTAKSFLAAALGAFATEGSLNNYLGVPLSLAGTPKAATAVVVELGMNRPGELAPLAQLAAPDIALLVNVGTAHQENFSDPDGIRREKLSIAAGLKGDGWLVLHDAINTADVAVPETRLRRFGTTPNAAVQLLSLKGTEASYRVGARVLKASVPGGGWHRALTLAGVLAVVDLLDAPLAAAQRLPQSLVPAGRGRRHHLGAMTVIDDSYNANPASMMAALTQLQALPDEEGERFALLGSMAELGPATSQAHRQILRACSDLDGLWLVGRAWEPHLAACGGGLCGFWPELDGAAVTALLKELRDNRDKESNLLIKGSNSVFWKTNFVAQLLAQ